VKFDQSTCDLTLNDDPVYELSHTYDADKKKAGFPKEAATDGHLPGEPDLLMLT
jgi:hypothetical protein